jgi:hypothetical protein
MASSFTNFRHHYNEFASLTKKHTLVLIFNFSLISYNRYGFSKEVVECPGMLIFFTYYFKILFFELCTVTSFSSFAMCIRLVKV